MRTGFTGKIHIIEDNLDITESDNLIDFAIEDNCYVNDKFIGTTVAKKITVNILNPNNSINLENKGINVETGIITENTIEKIPFGTFIIEKPQNEEVKQKTSFVGYDYMIKFNVPYTDRVTYPILVGELFQDLCNQVGIEAGNIDFVNSNYMILGNPFTNNEDCRTVLSNIAQLAGGFAKIGRDNKVYIKTLKKLPDLLKVKEVHFMSVKELNLKPINMVSGIKNNTDESLDGNNYFEDFSKNNMWGELNSLVIGLSNIEGENTTINDKDSIEKNGLTELTIADNYFLINQEEREKVINPLWTSLNKIKYLPFKTQYYGYPWVDSGDIIYIEDTKDVGYVSYILNHTFKYNGTYSGTIDTPALTKTQTAYKNTMEARGRIRRVELSVDKINGNITSIVETVETQRQDISGVSYIANNANINASNSDTKAQQALDQANNIQNSLDDYKNTNEQSIIEIKKSVETTQTDSQYAINVAQSIMENGTTKLDTKTGFKFNNEGLTIKKDGAETLTTLNEIGLDVKDNTGHAEESLLFAGYDKSTGETVVKSKNMTVEKYLTMGKYSRIEDYENGTGIFYLGGI